jgi:hypothetical protein
MLIAAVVGIMIVGALGVALPHAAFAINIEHVGPGIGRNGVNHPGHNACDNAGPAEHNPHCQ